MRKLILGGTLMSLCLWPSFASSFVFSTLDASTVPGGPGAGATNTFVYGISNSGLMVGQYTFGGVTYSFTYNGTTFSIVNPAGISIAGQTPVGISYRGVVDLTGGGTEIVGDYTFKNGGSTVADGFTDVGGTYSQVAVSGQLATFVNGVNSSGNIVGLYLTSSSTTRAFDVIGGTTTTGLVCSGNDNTNGFGINASNTLAGYCAPAGGSQNGWVYTQGSGFQVGSGSSYPDVPFAGAGATFVTAIDNAGDLAGYYLSGGDDIGFLYTANGATWQSIAAPGALNTEIFGINNKGELVGAYNTTSGGTFVGFYAVPQAAGVPEPSSVLLTMSAMGGLGFLIRRKRLGRKA